MIVALADNLSVLFGLGGRGENTVNTSSVMSSLWKLWVCYLWHLEIYFHHILPNNVP